MVAQQRHRRKRRGRKRGANIGTWLHHARFKLSLIPRVQLEFGEAATFWKRKLSLSLPNNNEDDTQYNERNNKMEQTNCKSLREPIGIRAGTGTVGNPALSLSHRSLQTNQRENPIA